MKYFSKRTSKGFTLIELMIVIAIIAVLAAILVPNFMRARAQSQLAACEGNLKNSGTAVAMYGTDNNGNAPGANASVSGSFGAGSAATLLSPTYLQTFPTCPGNGSLYSYSATNYTSYTISQQTSGVNPHANVLGTNTKVGSLWAPVYGAAGGLKTQ